MAVETELKLGLSEGDASRLARSPCLDALGAGPARTARLLSIYFDTPSLDLWRSGIALRVRRVGRGWVQTVKGDGGVAAGLHSRSEHESPVAGPQPDFTRLGPPDLAERFASPGLRAALAPAFTTEFRRTLRQVSWTDGSAVELAMDRGWVRSGPNEARVCEAELELKAGHPAALFELALALVEDLDFTLEGASKAERGYELFAGLAPRVVKAATPPLEPGMSVNDAFKAIAWGCLSQLQANERGMLQGREPEHLHQMRVALRRLRSALSVFSRAYTRAEFVPVRAELGAAAAELGPARDWDVFATETLPPILARLPDYPGLPALAAAVEETRARHNASAREMVRSRRYHLLMLRLGAWLAREPWLRVQPEPVLAAIGQPARAFADEVLSRAHRRVCKGGRHLARLTAPELHQLRIAGKRLRYTGEFFAALFPRTAAREFLQALARLQDTLGTLNDATVTRRLLAELNAADPALREAAGVVEGWVACAAAGHGEELAAGWKAFLRRPLFWKHD